MAVRQEVLNVLLAQLLTEQGLTAAPEQIIRSSKGHARMPDVLVDFQDLRLVIEGEFDAPQAEEKATAAALGRVDQGIAHMGIAVIYPRPLKNVRDISELKEKLAQATLRFWVVTESEATQLSLLPELEKRPAFSEGDLDTLADTLRRAYQHLIQDSVLEKAVGLLEQGLDAFMEAVSIQPASTDRFARVLGIQELPKAAGQPKERHR